MALRNKAYRLILLLCCIAPFLFCPRAQATSLYQSVEQAIAYSPQLRALAHGNQAIEHDLKQARGRYRPSIDLLLGYGADQHSDSTTRQPDADPSDSEWTSRGDATLRLTQNIYDGGETSRTVSIQQAILESSNHELRAATQVIALNAISAHLDVYRQRELVALAKKDLQVHQDIYRSLSEIEQAGAGNIADVTQTQTRLERARTILIVSQGDLNAAISTYERVVGVKPGELAFAGPPETTPASLDEALAILEEKNPSLMASNARLLEANARVDLARSAYKPKLNIELSSRYRDQLEGDPSWQQTNDAMLVMRWNLFNGGQDKEAANAALSRKYQSRFDRDDKLSELRESTATVWATYLSLKIQKKAFRVAVASSRKTFDAYLEQFSVSRRSLLDVLNAEKEYFQSARMLIDVSVDEVLAAYRILNLVGDLTVPEVAGAEMVSTDLSLLAQAIALPSVALSADGHLSGEPERLFAVEVGPCINSRLSEQAEKRLHHIGVDYEQSSGKGLVKMIRLREGDYQIDEAYRRLDEVRAVVDAYVIPEGDKLVIYVGSFHDRGMAMRYARQLEEKEIDVTLVEAEVEMQGSMLVVQPVDEQTAEAISEQMEDLRLTTEIKPIGK
jgi:adhesin transport system outer membrane protein